MRQKLCILCQDEMSQAERSGCLDYCQECHLEMEKLYDGETFKKEKALHEAKFKCRNCGEALKVTRRLYCTGCIRVDDIPSADAQWEQAENLATALPVKKAARARKTIPSEHKCKSCKAVKPGTAFYFRPKYTLGISNECRECHNTKHREREQSYKIRRQQMKEARKHAMSSV